jgi:hypothetical protein
MFVTDCASFLRQTKQNGKYCINLNILLMLDTEDGFWFIGHACKLLTINTVCLVFKVFCNVVYRRHRTVLRTKTSGVCSSVVRDTDILRRDDL